MANIQTYFNKFHDEIRVKNFEENEVLRQKRDIILDKLKDKLPDFVPAYTTMNQGSYAMKTGVKPIDGEYDIDVALLFQMSKDDYEAIEAKKWVYEALEGHTDNVKIKVPCVTVTYKEKGKEAFHVDLTIYTTENDDGETYLAKGKLHSKKENQFWDISNPDKLINKVNSHYKDEEERKQFRRVIRYMKRWKDVNFSGSSNGKPTGISLTACALKYMEPKVKNFFTNEKEIDDLSALITFVKNIKDNFSYVYNTETETWNKRLNIELPVPPGNDLLEKMTDSQMNNFWGKLINLLNQLEEAEKEIDIVEQTELLRKAFGSDFPVAEKVEEAKAKRKAIVTDESSFA